MSYWDETDRIKAELGGNNPTCPIHGCEMFPCDDHGRFACMQCGFGKVHDLSDTED
jgi:hypothetical protein